MPTFPLKDYLYVGAIVALLAGFGIYTYHERAVGAAGIKAQDAALAAEQKQHRQDVTDVAQGKTVKIGDTYVAITHTAIPDSPHVVCYQPPHRAAVPQAASDPGVPAGTSDVPTANSYDPGPPLDAVGRNADARINALIDLVYTLLGQMNETAK